MLAPLSHVMEAALVELDAMSKLAERPPDDWRLKMGLPALDDVLLHSSAGLKRGQVVEVRGQHGSGRSAFLGHVARQVALRQNAGALLVAPRTFQEHMLLRLLLAEARVEWRALRGRRLKADELTRVQDTAAALWNAPLWVNDKAPTLGQLEHDCRAVESDAHAARVLLVDDLAETWAADTRDLRRLATDLGLVLIAVRDVESPVEGLRFDVTLTLRTPKPSLQGPIEPLDIDIHQVEGPDATVRVGLERATGRFVDSV
jgi:replicative DNA helicase